MSEEAYDPVKCLREEVDRFKATNQFSPMLVTHFYAQAACVLSELERTREERDAAKNSFHAANKERIALRDSNDALILQLGGIQSCIAEELRLDKTPTTVEEIRPILRSILESLVAARW